MTKLSFTTFPDEDAWLRSIGRFIWSMGQLEYLAIEWCYQLGGGALRDQAIDKTGFVGRYQLLVAEIQRSKMPEDRKREALHLWRKAKCFATFRNKIAHAPVVSFCGQSGLVDARSLKGSGRREVSAFGHQFISSTSDHIQRLAHRLDWDFS